MKCNAADKPQQTSGLNGDYWHFYHLQLLKRPVLGEPPGSLSVQMRLEWPAFLASWLGIACYGPAGLMTEVWV